MKCGVLRGILNSLDFVSQDINTFTVNVVSMKYGSGSLLALSSVVGTLGAGAAAPQYFKYRGHTIAYYTFYIAQYNPSKMNTATSWPYFY